MSFYVSLFSDKSMQTSSIGSFYTILHKPIILNGSYEVALAEISYPINWYVKLGSLLIKSNKSKETIHKIDFELNDYSNPDEFLSHASYKFGFVPADIKVKTSTSWNSKNNTLIFNFEDPKSNHSLVMDEMFARSFRINYSNKQFNNKYILNFRGIENISHLFVYCDIITNQFDGNTKSKLLRTVKVKGNAQEVVHNIFDNPHYCQINKTCIDSIEINIKDRFNNNILFKSGLVFVKLHFRKVQ